MKTQTISKTVTIEIVILLRTNDFQLTSANDELS